VTKKELIEENNRLAEALNQMRSEVDDLLDGYEFDDEDYEDYEEE
jgi:hypothetical protein